ncbi:MAG TPA: hypothetical protein VKY22_14105 [Bradyrhizobium sp.]|nr:hypothetical protein [Bradyrhizobium sp.]
MIKHKLPPAALAICIATFPFIPIQAAQAKQQCSAAASSDQHGYWSWRIIDGRKCWYEGKPMLSKSLLEWPAETSARPDPATPTPSSATQMRSDPLDAQAWEPAPSDTFETLWRQRIEQH